MMELDPDEARERSSVSHIKHHGRQTASNWKKTQVKAINKHNSEETRHSRILMQNGSAWSTEQNLKFSWY